MAQRYPARRTFDGVRPTQKIIDVLKAEGPMDRDKLWERCKAAGTRLRPGAAPHPAPPQACRARRTSSTSPASSISAARSSSGLRCVRSKCCANPSRSQGPEGTKYNYLLNYLSDSQLKKESRPNMPRWRPAAEETEADAEGIEGADEAEAAAEEEEGRAAQKLQQAAMEARAKKQQAAAEQAMAAFEKAL